MRAKRVALHIDTSKTKEASIALSIDGRTYTKHSLSSTAKAQALLGLIATALREHALHTQDLKEITVVTGPGSFTGLRVGLSVANALWTLLHIPINGKKALATPAYS